MPVDLKADSSDSNNYNDIIFIIGIRANSRIKLLFFTTVFGQFLLCCCDRERCMI